MTTRSVSRSAALILLGVLVSSVHWWASPYELNIATIALKYVVLGLALNFVFGYAGRVSFGHSGFFGIAGYAAAIAAERWSVPAVVAAPSAVLLAVLVALIVAVPLLRLRGHYLALGTLAFGLVVITVAEKFTWLTEGANGMLVPTPTFLSINLRDWAYFLWLGAAALAVFVAHRVRGSKYGRALLAIREDEDAARAAGIHVERYTVAAFVWSAALVAMAGVLHGYTFRVMAPEVFDLRLNIVMLLLVTVAGLGSTSGVVIAAYALALMPEVLLQFEEREQLYYGALLLGIMIFAPRGLGDALRQLGRWLARVAARRSGATDEDEPLEPGLRGSPSTAGAR